MSFKCVPTFAFCALLLGALTACGFRPLYAPPAEDATGRNSYAFDVFRAIEIDHIEDRKGQYLRNQLIKLLQPYGGDRQRRYVLDISLSENTRNLSVRKSSFATRANLTMTASYSLVSYGSKKPLIASKTSVTSGYNIFDSEFQTLAAVNGARERALDTLAQQIRIRLATGLSARETDNKSK